MLFRAREYLRGSLWVFPLAGAIVGVLLAVLTKQADASVTVPTAWQHAQSTASTVLTTIVGATVDLAGFVVTVTVLAIQMATETFSARYMRIWYRDPLLKAVLTVLAGTMTFSFSLLRQVSATRAPNIGTSVPGSLLVLSLVLFLLFFDRSSIGEGQPPAAEDGRIRRQTDHRARSRFRHPDHGGHRGQGALGRHQ